MYFHYTRSKLDDIFRLKRKCAEILGKDQEDASYDDIIIIAHLKSRSEQLNTNFNTQLQLWKAGKIKFSPI